MRFPPSAIALAFCGGLALGWYLYRPQVVVETPAPAARQADSSLVLERIPDRGGKPAHLIPKGGKVERIVSVTVEPRLSNSQPAIKSPVGDKIADSVHASGSVRDTVNRTVQGEQNRCKCAPVTIDLTLVRMPDNTRRVVASSPDGKIIGGVDVPVESAAPARDLKWAAGVVWTPQRAYPLGGYISRDVGPARLMFSGVYFELPDKRATVVTQIGLGIRF